MNFFLDHCMSPYLSQAVAILQQGQHLFRHITEDPRFDRTTNDLDWLPVLAADNLPWIIISGDANIIDTPQERAMLINCNLTFFCMDKHWMRTNIDDMAWKFFKVWPEIVRYSRNTTPSLHVVRTGPGNRLGVDVISHGYRARGGRMRD